MATMFIGQLIDPEPAAQLRGLTARVVAFQVSAFVLMEVLERLTAGSPLADLLRSGILPIGVAAQVAIGYLAARAIRWLLRAADRVAATLATAAIAPHPDAPRAFPPEAGFAPAGRHLSAAGVRGPPSSV